MEDRDLYRQKAQAKLDEWKAELDKLKARASGASADGRLQMNREMEVLEEKLKDARSRLAELAEAGSENWGISRSRLESHWDGIRERFQELKGEARSGEAPGTAAAGSPASGARPPGMP